MKAKVSSKPKKVVSGSATRPECSFCSQPLFKVRVMIAGPTVYICDECIGLCCVLIAGSKRRLKIL